MKRFGLLALVVVVLALAAACAPAADKILCPLNYNLVGVEDCKVGSTNPDVTKYELVDALWLGQNEAGVYTPPGDRPLVVVTTIGYNAVPDKYTKRFPTQKVTYRTIGSPIDPAGNFQGCTEFENKYKLCATPLDQVRLKGGVLAVVDYEVDFTVTVNDETASVLSRLQNGFGDLVKSLDGFSRDEMRRANEVDPSTYTDGSMDALFKAKLEALMPAWEYAGVVEINAVRVRKVSVPSYEAQATEIQGEQGEKNAAAFATQTVIACGSFREEAYRAYCMAIYVWSQKNDGSSPPPPPVGYAPIQTEPATVITP